MYCNHPCKCANNKSGQCYGNVPESYHFMISKGINDVLVSEPSDEKEWTLVKEDPATGEKYYAEVYKEKQQKVYRAFVETDCPGYIPPGDPMFEGVPQGDRIVKPFKD
jgi:hypothetical protein